MTVESSLLLGGFTRKKWIIRLEEIMAQAKASNSELDGDVYHPSEEIVSKL